MDAETKTILVVDDNPMTARWVECLVRHMGFDAAVAFDGDDAQFMIAVGELGSVERERFARGNLFAANSVDEQFEAADAAAATHRRRLRCPRCSVDRSNAHDA